MNKRKVLIPTKLDSAAGELLSTNGRYEVLQDDSGNVAALAAKHPDAYAVIVRSEKVNRAIIDGLPSLKVIVRAGAGYDNIDTRYARSKKIDVMTTPGANSNAVAEEVVALMLADARHLIAADASAREGKWEKTRFMGREISGKTVGIVGLGNIGRLVAKLLSGFEVRLLGYDPVLSAERAVDMGVELSSLEAIFQQSDYVTLHVPENDETRSIVSDRLLGLMKAGATIVNCARAGIIDEDALRRARASKKIRFLNDVYAKDQEGPKSVADIADIMLPHLGASTAEANSKAARRAAEELIEFDERGVTSFIVNRDIPEGLDEAFCTLSNTLSRLCRCLSGSGSQLKQIETVMYGSLQKYAEWLLVPIVAGIWPDFDRSLDYRAALKYLHDMGIDYTNHEPDHLKRYGNAIAIHFLSTTTGNSLQEVGVRGTIAENTQMVSRINEFDKLYFEPQGHTVFFLYQDRPGVLGAIGKAMAGAQINIEDVRSPHDAKTDHSLAIMKVNKPVPQELIDAITKDIHALAAFHIKL